MRAVRALLALALFLASLTSAHVGAQVDAATPASLAGVYKAGIAQTKVDVSAWGEDCGPRPRSSTDNDHPAVTVKAQGKQLTLVFPDRKLRSDGCWSPNPAVRVASATASAGRWRIECQTPDSDAKRERGVYTLSASAEGVLDLLEESNYDWQLNQSRCVAKIRVTQQIARGDAIASLDKPEPTPVAAPTPVVCTPGPLAKLRMRPTDVRMTPGERTCFSVRGVDAHGCALPDLGGLKWELSKPAGASATLSGSCFKAATSAAEAEGQFRVTVSAGALHDETTVTVQTPDLSDITARRNSGNNPELEVQDGEDGITSSFGIEAAVKRSSPAVKLALGALLLALIAGLSWFVFRTRRRAERADLGLADTYASDDGPVFTPSGRPAPLSPSGRPPTPSSRSRAPASS